MFKVGEKAFVGSAGGPMVTVVSIIDNGYTVKFTDGANRDYPESWLCKYDYHDRLAAAGIRHESRSCIVCQQNRA